MFKWLILVLFILILVSLFSGLFFLVRDKGKSGRTVRSLTYRIGFSILLLVTLIVGAFMGWITPHTLKQVGPPEVESTDVESESSETVSEQGSKQP